MTTQNQAESATAAAEARSALLGCAAYGSPGARRSLPAAPLGPLAWQSFASSVGRQRITGLAARAVADGAFAVTAQQRDEIEQLELGAAVLALQLDAVLLDTATRLAGVTDYRVLKGAALANLDYPDPAMRCYGDVDVLVSEDGFDAALAALVDAGGTPRFAEPRAGFTRRFGKGVAVGRSDGFEVDLHRTLVSGPLGLSVHLDDLFGPPDRFEIGGTPLPALGAELRFLHACFHTALGSARPRLVPVRDVAQTAHSPRLDESRVRELAAAWRAEAVVAQALCVARQTFGITERSALSDWAESYRARRAERQALWAYTTHEDRYARQALRAVGAIDGLRPKAAYVRALLLPSRGYLAERESTYLRRWRRALRLACRTGAAR